MVLVLLLLTMMMMDVVVVVVVVVMMMMMPRFAVRKGSDRLLSVQKKKNSEWVSLSSDAE